MDEETPRWTSALISVGGALVVVAFAAVLLPVRRTVRFGPDAETDVCSSPPARQLLAARRDTGGLFTFHGFDTNRSDAVRGHVKVPAYGQRKSPR